VRIAVLGLGNVLRRDDGVGPAVVARLEARFELPADVEVLDLGTPGLDLVDQLVHRDAVVFVDAIVHAGAPGSVRVLTPAALRGSTGRVAASPRMTSHEAGVDDALTLAALDGRGPRHVRLVGVVAEDLGDGPGFSRAVEAAVPAACDAVLAELRALGVEATRRAVPRPDAAWWRTPAIEGVAGAPPA
jgi:hydrogenase maturation protease